jgi:hypothetical protein
MSRSGLTSQPVNLFLVVHTIRSVCASHTSNGSPSA